MDTINVRRQDIEAIISFIIRDLRCECKCRYKESLNQPCSCGFTIIEELFRDDIGVEFKEYPEAVKKFYEQYI